MIKCLQVKTYIRLEDIFMSNLYIPFRYDYVGSFLRPENLKLARRQFDEGRITYAQLKEVEDQAIIDLMAQKYSEIYECGIIGKEL